MKDKSLLLSVLFILSLVFVACGGDEEEKTKPSPKEGPKTVDLSFAIYPDVGNIIAKYKAVRIGEYLWMTTNFNHEFKAGDQAITQAQIDKCMEVYAMNPAEYQIENITSWANFNKYFGTYCDRDIIEFYYSHARIFEDDDLTHPKQWILPYIDDFRQLFAMCGDASSAEIVLYLGAKLGENPLARACDGGWLLKTSNTNVYGFSMMPGGGRFNGAMDWTPWTGPGAQKFSAEKGDFHGFLQTAEWVTQDPGSMVIHDYPEGKYGKSFHWLNMRWCRRLTDQELGYKLYANSPNVNQVTDIVELALDASPPSGYVEIPKGYLRGFYVQFILGKEFPERTIEEVVKLACNPWIK
jgi:uncharacterized protein (TIGR02145 family)